MKPAPAASSPDEGAYTTAALTGIAAMAITTITSLALACQRSPETKPAVPRAGTPSQGQPG